MGIMKDSPITLKDLQAVLETFEERLMVRIIDHVNLKIDEQTKYIINYLTGEFNDTIDGLIQYMDGRFNHIDGRFDRLEQRLEGNEKYLKGVDSRVIILERKKLDAKRQQLSPNG